MKHSTFRRRSAVAYARRWALARNEQYYDYSAIGGDCTNFASQALFAGSRQMDLTPVFGWYYRSANEKAPAWTGAEFLYRYLIRAQATPGPFAVVSERGLLQPGDLVQLSFDADRFSHTLVVTQTAPELLICAHSEDSLDRPLASYRFQLARYLHIVSVNR